MSTTKKLLRGLGSLLPERLAGVAEYHIRPERIDMWGPLNGQCYRQLVFIEIFRTCHFDAVVETGTFKGATSQFFALNCGVPIYSSEMNPGRFEAARRRLKRFPNVQIYNLDSRPFLKQLPLARTAQAFFYLDAHAQGQNLPLAEETEFIIQNFDNFVIMIDDFQIPGDRGYGFDDYGPRNSLTLKDFPFHQDPRISVYVPNRRSDQESGARRGCVVLVSPGLKAKVGALDSLVPVDVGALAIDR